MNIRLFSLLVLVISISHLLAQERCVLLDTDIDIDLFIDAMRDLMINYTIVPYDQTIDDLQPCILTDSDSRIVFKMEDIENIRYLADTANIQEWQLLISVLDKALSLNNQSVSTMFCGNETAAASGMLTVMDDDTNPTTVFNSMLCSVLLWGDGMVDEMAGKDQSIKGTIADLPLPAKVVRDMVHNLNHMAAYDKLLEKAQVAINQNSARTPSSVAQSGVIYNHFYSTDSRGTDEPMLIDYVEELFRNWDNIPMFTKAYETGKQVVDTHWNHEKKFILAKKAKHVYDTMQNVKEDVPEDIPEWMYEATKPKPITAELGHAVNYVAHNIIHTASKINKHIHKTGGLKGASDVLNRHHHSRRKNTRSPYLTSYHVSKAVHTGRNVRITPHHLYTALPYKQTPDRIPFTAIATGAYWSDQWWTGLGPNDKNVLRIYHLRDLGNFLYYNLVEWVFGIDSDPSKCRPRFPYAQDKDTYGCTITELGEVPPLFTIEPQMTSGNEICKEFHSFNGYVTGVMQLLLSDFIVDQYNKHPGWKVIPYVDTFVRSDNTTETESTVGDHVLPCLFFKGFWFLSVVSGFFGSMFVIIVCKVVLELQLVIFKEEMTEMKEVAQEARESMVDNMYEYDTADYLMAKSNASSTSISVADTRTLRKRL
jgi:hypothetical protein